MILSRGAGDPPNLADPMHEVLYLYGDPGNLSSLGRLLFILHELPSELLALILGASELKSLSGNIHGQFRDPRSARFAGHGGAGSDQPRGDAFEGFDGLEQPGLQLLTPLLINIPRDCKFNPLPNSLEIPLL